MPPRRSGSDYIVDENGCWVWQHAISSNGYGSLHKNGRRHGAHVVHAKLTEEIAAEIRSSPESGKALAKRFGVAPCTISHVRRGFSWRVETEQS